MLPLRCPTLPLATASFCKIRIATLRRLDVERPTVTDRSLFVTRLYRAALVSSTGQPDRPVRAEARALSIAEDDEAGQRVVARNMISPAHQLLRRDGSAMACSRSLRRSKKALE